MRKGRQALQPVGRAALSAEDRTSEIDRICAGFVTTMPSLRMIRRVILERLLPPGSGLPGPHVTEEELRAALEANYREGYKDVFRRVRELQGEEALIGLVKYGRTYQLQNLAIGQKRVPRQTVPLRLRQQLAQRQGWRCAVCGHPIVAEGPDRCEPDHRIPRVRPGSSNEPANLQALCPTCNIGKSAQCSNCELDCRTCSWAFPERFRAPKLRPDVLLLLNEAARTEGVDLDELANRLIERQLGH